MQSIGVVTNMRKAPLGNFLKNNLEAVFTGCVTINNYYFDELKPGDAINDDVVLVMIKSKVLDVKKYVAESSRIIVVNRTIQASEIYKLFSIPHNTKVLVVNDDPETTLEMVALLCQLEINHLNFVPCKGGQDYDDIKIAVTPGESHLVPRNISTIIDVGHRCIDISTFIKIANRLGIVDREISRRIIRYSESTIVLELGIKKQYKELFMKNTELDTIVNLSREGIMLINTDGEVTVCNHSLRKMLDIRGDISGFTAVQVLPPPIVTLLDQDDVKDEILEYKGRSLIVNKQDIEYCGEKAGTYYNFQEVTYIKQLEQNFTKKLRDKGLVSRYHFTDIRTNSAKMHKCIELARKIAGSDLTVLIVGESGTGKELLAQSIHNASTRSIQPFVAVNCAAVPENLLESELFGYEGGAFTGALKEGKVGLFEQANNGTIFLDEIGDMPYMLQAKLLRVLQERQIMRIGSRSVININIRIIAATNHDLREKIRTGQFREDLYYRLNVLPLMVPPLRERTEDILYLLNYFLSQNNKQDIVFSPETGNILTQYKWPGNIRELSSVASYISFMAADTVVTSDMLPYYILDSQESFEWESSVLISRCGIAKAREVLSVIAEFESLGMGAGRKTIEEALAVRGLRMTEGEIRGLLTLLNEIGLIHSSVGRRGSEITAKGKLFIKWLKNR